MRDTFRLSTQLFNGDYLAAQAAEDSARHQSRNILPHKFLVNPANASVGKFSRAEPPGRRARGARARDQLLGQSF